MAGWTAGIDGGTWEWCSTCRTTTPPTEQGTCATCGSIIVKAKQAKATITHPVGCECQLCTGAAA